MLTGPTRHAHSCRAEDVKAPHGQLSPQGWRPRSTRPIPVNALDSLTQTAFKPRTKDCLWKASGISSESSTRRFGHHLARPHQVKKSGHVGWLGLQGNCQHMADHRRPPLSSDLQPSCLQHHVGLVASPFSNNKACFFLFLGSL